MSSFTDPHVFPKLYYFFIDQNYTLTYLLYGGEKIKGGWSLSHSG